jgi:hypothetical protein
MRKLALLLLLFPVLAGAQSYPSPTFDNLTILGTCTGCGGGGFPPSGTTYTSGTLTWTGIASGNLSTASTWTALQTFGTEISIGGVQPTGATGTGAIVFSASPTFTGTLTAANLTVTGTCTGCGSGSGITQLTGDVTAGPGSGSTPATVVQINGVAPPTTCSAGVGGWSSGGAPGCINASGGVAVSNNQIFDQRNCYAPSLTSNAYTAQTSDWSKCLEFSNGSTAATLDLPVATTSGFGAGYYLYVVNYGTAAVTITPTTSTIAGAATLAINGGGSCLVSSDGTNYQTPICNTNASSSGETHQAVMMYESNIAQATTDYCPVAGTCGASSSALQTITPLSGSFKNLYVHVNAAPASGQTFQFTIFTGTSGSSLSASALTCTISNPNTSCSDASDNPSVTAGNSWNLQVITSSTSGSAADIQVSFSYNNPT